MFIDAAQIHETHFAHEIGHLWIQYVELAEDERVLEDVSDAARLNQLAFVQSFVTDLRINQVIAEKGFDVSVIRDDQAASVASLGRAIEAGYRPDTKREGVFMALALAGQIIEERTVAACTLALLDDTLAKVKGINPELAQLSYDFADAIARRGYQDKAQIRSSIDECLKLAFDFTGDGIDLEHDLVYPPVAEPDFEKNPEWLWGASPQMKCEVGRIMARESIPDGSTWSITQDQSGKSLLTFELPDGTVMGTWTLEDSQAFTAHTERIHEIGEMNRQNRERQMKQQPANGMPNFPGQPRRFYMAGTARFLTRVREAEWVGGEAPYGYAMNNPVNYSDPSGMEPCLQKCCCNLDSFTSSWKLIPPNDVYHWGHIFTVLAKMTNRIKKAGDKDGTCSLKWYEKTDLPYVPGMRKDSWQDLSTLAGLVRPDLLFAQRVPTGCPEGPSTWTFDDPPQLGKRPGRTGSRMLCIKVVVTDGCSGKALVERFNQYIEVKSGKIIAIVPPDKSKMLQGYCSK